ncbi:hypothetical protein DICPUDRAFT_43486 [Dictyostelium purpureum]|uniref:Ribosomal RNA methyltransferase FtsJ domain-containing protein n=1 Tax=Dictyostelium purpureum TaxID=5786 RepID=F1A488_DICPU|nr:uncharacterized protein DICPUDRAFT_43486 [Dictyostelium purpureum]EGC28997.1 hypothetical protein DICPUDRAFT_43486 [Dictyostelium purpureum]|eukprot:XP_003294482.1 hypothetical protein DICPUDRAFT_43486 [Dictyostelium purpureum]
MIKLNNSNNNNVRLFSLIRNYNNNNNNNTRTYYKSSLVSLKKNNNYNPTNNQNNDHINKPSVSKEDSLYQIFQKYEFNNKDLPNQSIWLPFLKTQYYDFNPYPSDTLKMSQTQIATINSLSKFKDLLKKELRSLNKNNNDTTTTTNNNSNNNKNNKNIKVNKNNNSNNNNDNNNNIKIKSSEDFLNSNFNKEFLNYLNINFENDEKFNNSMIWTQQILPNSFKIKRLPVSSSNMDIAKECFNYLYPILSYLHYYYGDQFYYSIQAFNNTKEDPLNQDNETEKEFRNKIKRVKKSLEILLESTRKRLWGRSIAVPENQTIGIAFNNINNLNGLDFLKDKEKAFFIVQILFSEGNSNDIYVSVARTTYKDGRGWSFPLPFNQGVVPIERDQIPPSRAYKKLIESFETLGTTPSPSSTVVELGAAPGGWTSILERLYSQENEKLKIYTIDRSKLDSQFKTSTSITHTYGDGTKFTPSNIGGLGNNTRVDWLFNDMAIPASKSLEVLEKWIKNKNTTYFVWAIKFDAIEEASTMANDCHELMKRYNISSYRIKHMVYQGNEIMLMGKIE